MDKFVFDKRDGMPYLDVRATFNKTGNPDDVVPAHLPSAFEPSGGYSNWMGTSGSTRHFDK